MMIAKMLLCASAVVIALPQMAEARPRSRVARSVSNGYEPKATSVDQADSERAAIEKDQAAPSTAADSPDRVVDGVKLAAIEANIVSYTNQERARYGLPALEVDKELMETAREHAAWMTRYQAMVHTSRPVAENIAMGQPHSSDVVQCWMNSSGHRANILNPGHGRIGVAAYRTAGGVIFWCQQFRR
jgi:uncharacterized protein YkwD